MRLDKVFGTGGYHTTLATTYRFDALVFEQVPLVRMRSADCRNIVVLADRDMVNAATAETGAPTWAGTRYHLAKRKVAGAFHSKILLQLGEKTGRLIVGSANLTGAGIYGNLEAVSTLEATENDRAFAPVLAAALAYIARHADPGDPAMRRALERARRWTPWLAANPPARSVEGGGGRIRFVTEEDPGGVGGAVIDTIGTDVIERLICIAPYWDADLSGLARLRATLGGPPTHLVVDPAGQDFDAATLADQEGVSVHPGDELPRARTGADRTRRLHAKIVVACGKAADYVLTGSANISRAGLFGNFEGPGNAEAGILRIEQRGTAIARLGLAPCLSAVLAPGDLCLRRDDAAAGSQAGPSLLDGGAVYLDGAGLWWSPPAFPNPGECLVELLAPNGASLGAAHPEHHGDRIWLEGIDKPQYAVAAVVHFPGGDQSAPLPVTALGRLEKEARGQVGGRTIEALRTQIETSVVDADILDLYARLEQHLVAHRAAHAARTGARGARRAEEDPSGKDGEASAPGNSILDPESFGALGEEHVAATARLEDAINSDWRRLLNATLGRAWDVTSGDNEEDDTVLDEIRNEARQLAETTGADDIAHDEENEDPGHPPPPATRKASEPAMPAPRSPRREMALRRGSLRRYHAQMLVLLADPKTDALETAVLLKTRLLVRVIIGEAAPLGAAPSEQYVLPFDDPNDGWVRMLGRLLKHFSEALDRSTMLHAPATPDEGRIEGLADALAAAQLSHEAALAGGCVAQVTQPLTAVCGSLARQARLATETDTAAARLVERIVKARMESDGNRLVAPAIRRLSDPTPHGPLLPEGAAVLPRVAKP